MSLYNHTDEYIARATFDQRVFFCTIHTLSSRSTSLQAHSKTSKHCIAVLCDNVLHLIKTASQTAMQYRLNYSLLQLPKLDAHRMLTMSPVSMFIHNNSALHITQIVIHVNTNPHNCTHLPYLHYKGIHISF